MHVGESVTAAAGSIFNTATNDTVMLYNYYSRIKGDVVSVFLNELKFITWRYGTTYNVC